VAAGCASTGSRGSSSPGRSSRAAIAERAIVTPAARDLGEQHGRVVAGSAYLGGLVPESADVHNILGIALAEKGRLEDAIAEFRLALRLDPGSAPTHWHLGAALAYHGARDEAVEHLRRSVQLDPDNADARRDLDAVLALDPRR
jgi:Flp pilus assembly protein TadD